ncbi:MAG: cyclodeaminase/cyclohydrolase family protein [Phycisphaerales bacterium]
MARSLGLHHVTGITADPQRNHRFYASVLGLRLVKRTVNFDDPRTPHLCYGDERGRPGTLITFFVWPNAPRGRAGFTSARSAAFAIPEGAAAEWKTRLTALGVAIDREGDDDGQNFLDFSDPDGTPLTLIECPRAAERACWAPDGISAALAIRGLYSVSISAADPLPTIAMLRDVCGMKVIAENPDRVMLAVPERVPGRYIMVERAAADAGVIGAGSLHHLAMRTADRASLERWVEALEESRVEVSPILDRAYLESVYFQSPSGVLFEVATDGPGFLIDEPAEHLGETLALPPHHEPRRAAIEANLPAIDIAPGPLPVTPARYHQSMSFSDQTFEEFLSNVAAKTPAPGGGAVASAVGALSAALAGMVVAYSVNKKDLAAHHESLVAAEQRLTRARRLLLALADEDAQAYAALNELSKLPESDPRRVAEHGIALRAAVQAPMAVAAAALDLLRSFEELAGKSNRFLRSDLGIAAVLADAAVRASKWNVLINAAQLPPAEAETNGRLVNQLLSESARRCAAVENACAV